MIIRRLQNLTITINLIQKHKQNKRSNRLFTNAESNGRFHTDWLNMIYPRLRLAKDLLRDDGVIFISIDENEVQNLRKICDEIFGEQNFISQLGWQKVYSPKNQARYFSNDYEFVLCYCRNIDYFSIGMLPRTAAMNARYKNPDNDPRGDWKPGDCVGSGERKNGYYDVVSPITGKVFNVPKNGILAALPETLAPIADGVHSLIQSVFDPSVLAAMVEDGNKTKIIENKLNENFAKQQFQTLWSYINHKYAYVFTDGTADKSIERRFAEDLDRAEEVCVYAKLPKGFHIPTPVGNYSPDWAIAFNEGSVKHIFFIAETKGTI